MDSSSTTDPIAFVTRRRLSALVTGLLLVVAFGLATGSAAAHNPACHQVAGPDGPHYDDDPTTGSPTAYSHNPNLMGVDRPNSDHPDHANSIHNREGSCSVGQSGNSGGQGGNGHR